MTPLHMAAEKNHSDCIEMLCANGADANASDNWVRPPKLAHPCLNMACLQYDD